MKKIVLIIISLFVILVGWLFYLSLTNNDEFNLNRYMLLKKDDVVINQPIYLSYDLAYYGNGKPILKDIRFIKKDGSFLDEDDDQLSITFYIDEKAATSASADGVILEEEARQLKLLDHYTPVENYEVTTKNLNIVAKLIIKNENYSNNITAMQIDYELLGKEKTKQFLISGLIKE
ncbi:hypothetical protein [Calidifontibacillus erzurumensis]|uniref:Uncharacterized protein n=1 Tax=Calidifontibacillus erzurumensis TaxID=2741433 RepID=A0A8J8GCF8_9BACI|nr:hypothetical protein [Calidifontibacillus erzurumensis]NSL50847.1 hypothetical protein [Calidifontibacillus erzurumensis]